MFFEQRPKISALLQKRRRRLDRNMIGEPMNFVHTAHVGAREMSSDYLSVSVHLFNKQKSPLSTL